MTHLSLSKNKVTRLTFIIVLVSWAVSFESKENSGDFSISQIGRVC